MTITLNGTTGITTPDVNSDGLTVDSTTLVVDEANNRVGIGTSSPSYKLDVLGGNAPFQIASTDATASLGITFKYNTSTVYGYLGNGSSILTGAASSDFVMRSEGAVVFTSNGNNERMRIDSAGRVTMPYQPAFRAYNASAAINSDVSFANKDSAFSGRDAGFSTSTGLFTAPVAGVYVFSFAFLHNNVTSTFARVLFKINGSASTSYGDTLVTVGGVYVNTSASMAFALAANDTVGLYNEGVAIYGTAFTSFSGFLIG